MEKKQNKSVQDEPKKVSKGRKQPKKEVIDNALEKVKVMEPQEPKPMYLTPLECENLRRLEGVVRIAERDAQLVTARQKDFIYQIKFAEKDKQLIDKTIEINKLKQTLLNHEIKEATDRKVLRERDYGNYVKEIGRKFNIDFSKCAFNPETGEIDVLAH
jgi:hypothetical protein